MEFNYLIENLLFKNIKILP